MDLKVFPIQIAPSCTKFWMELIEASCSLPSGPQWKAGGEYKVLKATIWRTKSRVQHLNLPAEMVPQHHLHHPPPPPPECGPGEELIGGECVDKEPVEPPPPECGPDQELIGGQCT